MPRTLRHYGAGQTLAAATWEDSTGGRLYALIITYYALAKRQLYLFVMHEL